MASQRSELEECPVLGGQPQPINCDGCTERCIPKLMSQQPMYATVNDISYVLSLIDEIREALQL